MRTSASSVADVVKEEAADEVGTNGCGSSGDQNEAGEG